MAKWTKEQVEQTLEEKGWVGPVREIQNGLQYSLPDGTTLNLYSTGKVVVGGRATDLKAQASETFADRPPVITPIATAVKAPEPILPSRVFIVYGHDAKSREELELTLRRLRLEPIVLQNLPAAGDTIIEKLETFTQADFACVLLTPDDEGHRCDHPGEKRPRARQNVVLELGMVLAKLGRKRVAILVKGSALERPSDIDGLIYLPFDKHVEETKNHLAANLQKAGFSIQVEDLLS